MYHFPIFLAVTVCLLFSNICFDTVCWLPVLASLMLISFSLVPHFSGFTTLWLHPFFFFSCILFLTICCSLLSFCHCFLLTLCREESFYCTVPITPVKREVEELDTIEEVSRVARLDVHGLPCQSTKACQFQVLSLDQKVYRTKLTLLLLVPNATQKLWLGYTCSDF